MFPKRYFAPRYFAQRYWPPVIVPQLPFVVYIQATYAMPRTQAMYVFPGIQASNEQPRTIVDWRT